MLERAEIERRLTEYAEAREHCPECHGVGHPFIDCGNELSGYDYRYKCGVCSTLTAEEEALETCQRQAELMEWQDRARFKPCETCPAKFPNGCVDDWETCEVESAKARAWLAGESGGGE